MIFYLTLFNTHRGGSRTSSEGRPAPQREGNLMNGLIDGYGVGGGRRGILAVTIKICKAFLLLLVQIFPAEKSESLLVTADTHLQY